MRRRVFLLLFLVALAGCDLTEDDFRPQVVVEGFLIAGEPLPTIRLSETAPIEVGYSFEAQAISGAEVTITVDELGAAYELVESRDFPGNYLVPFSFSGPTSNVVPGARYRLDVRLPNRPDLVPAGEVVSAETFVPDTFRVIRPPADTLAYNVFGPGPAIDVTASGTDDRKAVFIFSVTALDPDTYGLTPTYADLIDDDDDAEDLVDSASPLLNEENYDQNADGTLRIRVPWLAIAYYGPNRFTANALDDALFDYLRSRDAQFNPTTLSPGEIQRVLSNVENGVGVFGSLARVSVETFIAE